MRTAPLAEARRVAAWFHALSDFVRLGIVELLAHQSRCASEIEQTLDVNPSRLSFHLKVLKQSGLVTRRRDGKWVYYAIEPVVLEEMAAYVRLLKPGKRPLTCSLPCCHDLARTSAIVK
jgi:ArsR family transcriptional regulator